MSQPYSRILFKKVFLPTLIFVAGLSSCTQKMICPAYQSAFIYDTSALKSKFSYFENDTPKIVEVNQNKFHLGVPVSFRKKMAGFRTVEMLPVYPVIPDSLLFLGDEEMASEMDVQDSLAVAQGDSSATSSDKGLYDPMDHQKEEKPLHPGLIGKKFNVEQEQYMYYFRKILVLPDVRAGMAVPQKKGFFARLKDRIKNIFRRKSKEERQQRKEEKKKRKEEKKAARKAKKEALPEEDPPVDEEMDASDSDKELIDTFNQSEPTSAPAEPVPVQPDSLLHRP